MWAWFGRIHLVGRNKISYNFQQAAIESQEMPLLAWLRDKDLPYLHEFLHPVTPSVSQFTHFPNSTLSTWMKKRLFVLFCVVSFISYFTRSNLAWRFEVINYLKFTFGGTGSCQVNLRGTLKQTGKTTERKKKVIWNLLSLTTLRNLGRQKGRVAVIRPLLSWVLGDSYYNSSCHNQFLVK